MKKIAIYSFVAAMGAALSVGCADVANVEPDAPIVEDYFGAQTLTALISNAQSRIDFSEGETGIALDWADGDTFSVYEMNGAWVAEFAIEDVEASSFAAVAGGGDLVEGVNYVAVYPARQNNEASYAEYTSIDFTSMQSADASAALDHLGSACQMSAEFVLGDEVVFNHNKAIMTIQFDDIPSGATPTNVQFSDGLNNNYSLSLSGMAAAVDETTAYEVHMMVDPSEAETRDLTFVVTYDSGVNVYNIVTGNGKEPVAYRAGCRYTAPVKNQAEQQAKNYWQAISTADQLEAYLNGKVFKNAVLTADIDMGGRSVMPMANMGKIFDGNGHSISNLSIEKSTDQAGMFMGLSATGVVKNLTLEEPIVKGKNYVGAFAGKMAYGAVVTNCATYGCVIEASASNAGGIAGQSNGLIDDCFVRGSITADLNAGGIVGLAAKAAAGDCLVTACRTFVGVEARQNVAGVAGKATGAIISICACVGDVKATEKFAGGIIGYGGANEVVYGCMNVANIVSVSQIGSIVGSYVDGGQIIGCGNLGVVGDAAITTGSSAGIIGEAKADVTLVGCFNTSVAGKIPKGCMVGYTPASVNVTVTDCYYVAPAVKGAWGVQLATMSELNDAVEAMNAAINDTPYNSCNFVKGVNADVDTPIMILK